MTVLIMLLRPSLRRVFVVRRSISNLVVQEKRGKTQWIVLNNPKKRNVLNLEALKELRNAFASVPDTVSSVVLAAEGPAFSAGHDLKELTLNNGSSNQDISRHTEVFDSCLKMLNALKSIPVPVVCEVSGIAAAAGCQLAASSDIVIASEEARFATNGINVGFFCSTPAVALTRAVPLKAAALMLYTGQFISAQEALIQGLVSKVVPPSQLRLETEAIATRLSLLSRDALVLGKQVLGQLSTGQQTALESDYSVATKAMLTNLKFADCQQGIDDFIHKRTPRI